MGRSPGIARVGPRGTNLLKHPISAGAYVYGRRPVTPRRKQAGHPGTGRVLVAPEDWPGVLKDRLPASISWEQYPENQARLEANRARAASLGVVREGPALLTRLAVWARCGCRMAVNYTRRAEWFAYACTRQRIDYGEAACQHLAGASLDAWVSQQLLAALEPAALELALQAATHLEQERAERARLCHQRVERATSEAERAGRHYRLVEPENRLVARPLERDWEAKLVAQRTLEDAYRRFLAEQPPGLTAAEREAIRKVAAAIPALWNAPTTTAALRKALLRQVGRRVIVAVLGESERVQVTLEWGGGTQTAGEIVRPVGRLEQLRYYPQLCGRAQALAQEGLTTAAIAQRLNAEGYRPPKRREQFGPQGVQEL